MDKTLAFIQDTWNQFSPNEEFNYGFLDERLANLYTSEKRIGIILQAFSVLAVIVLCLGLVGLLGYSVSQRYKEISIRKVLGASTVAILIQLSKEYFRLILIAVLIAVPVANYFVEEWLKAFPFQVNIGVSIFVLPILVLFAISSIIVVLQAYRATKINAIETLKNE